jgi:hypothetical protein
MSATAHADAREEVAIAPPARSLPRLVMLAALVLWVYLGFAATWATGASVPIAWALVGAYLVPTALVFELGRRLPRPGPVTAAVLLRTMLAGSLLAALITATVNDGLGSVLSRLPWWATDLALPATAETLAVALVVRIIARRTASSPRSGLFLGGAIGAGYAAFEALGAILRALSALEGVPLPATVAPAALLEAAVTVQQAALAPLGHPVWGALIGAAVAVGGTRIGAVIVGVTFAHIAVTFAFMASGGLLGTSPAALVVQATVTAVASLPAFLAWRRTVRRTESAPGAAAGQAGGA